MSETYTTKSGQTITTNYEPQERTNYEGTAKGDSRKQGESRVEQNRRLRDESRAKVSSRSDSRENLTKEKKRKGDVERKIIAGRDSVIDRQNAEEEKESKQKKKVKSTKQHREPGPIDNLGRNVSGYISRNNGQPSWLFPQGGKKGKGNNMPQWIAGGYGGGKMPSWVLGGPAPWEEPKKATPRKARRVPAPKSTRPAWIRW